MKTLWAQGPMETPGSGFNQWEKGGIYHCRNCFSGNDTWTGTMGPCLCIYQIMTQFKDQHLFLNYYVCNLNTPVHVDIQMSTYCQS